jgi:membrane fusion protein, multidrug efflux system
MRISSIIVLIIFIALIALTSVIGIGVYKALNEETGEVEKEAKPIPVHVYKIGKGDVEDVVYITGKVLPADRADVIAKIDMPGKLIEAKVKEGDRVKKGQVIALVDRDIVGATYVNYTVNSPISGIVGYIQSDKGSIVVAQQPVATIIKTDKVKVKASVIERDLGRINKGTKARIFFDSYPDRVFKGKITRIEPVLDEFSHTVPLEIIIDNSDKALKPGMFAKVELVADTKNNVLVLPKNTITRKEAKNLAYVVKEDPESENKLRIFFTELELGYYDKNKYEVIAGMEEGDLAVDKDLIVFKDRTLVTISNPEDDPQEIIEK